MTAPAPVIAAFRAGRTAGFKEAIKLLVLQIDETPASETVARKRLLDACEKISAAATRKEPAT